MHKGTVLFPILILALAAGALLYAYISPKPVKFYTPDSLGYERIALNIVQNGAFSGQTEPPFLADLHRPPIYPAFMAVVYALWGHTPAAVVLLQVFIFSLTVALTFSVSRLLGLSTVAGLAAAAVLAVDPVSIMATNLLLTETLYTVLLVLGMAALAAYLGEGRIRWLVASALLLGLSGLTRPIGQYLPIVLLPIVVLSAGRGRARTVLPAGLLFILISMSITSAWAYRNYREGGVWTVSDTSYINLIYYRAREVLASVEGTSQDAAWRKLRVDVAQKAAEQNLGADQVAGLEQREAITVFVQHPTETVVMTAKGAGRILADPGFSTACTLLDRGNTASECFAGSATMNESDLFGKSLRRFGDMTLLQQATLAWSLALLAAVYVGAAAGVVSLIRQRRWLVLATCLSVLGYLFILSSGAEAYSRFRIPMAPFLAILFGAGLEPLTCLLRHRFPAPAVDAVKST